MTRVMMMKTKWYPRPHNFRWAYFHGLETGVNNYATILPIAMYDEGLGTPSDYEANPVHANFAEAAEPNCYVDSRINLIQSELRFALTKDALETDKIPAIRCAYMPIFLSFLENYTAIDELSQDEIQDVLRMQTESTDRQGYPLYNGVKMVEKASGRATLPANVPGLTTNQILEGVTFDENEYYDMLHYKTNAGKLKVSQGGLKWFTLTRNRPIANIKIHLRPKSKRMNPYTFFGVMTMVVSAGVQDQYAVAGDTTNVNHVSVDFGCRYNEWNQDFNFKKV